MKPGDIIYVDAGTYNLSTTLILNAAASGIQIVGYSNPSFPTRATVINRGNTTASVIELQNADNVTLDRLTIRGGSVGVLAANGSDSDNVTITNSVLTGNTGYGILLDSSNDFGKVLNNTFLSTGQLLSDIVWNRCGYQQQLLHGGFAGFGHGAWPAFADQQQHVNSVRKGSSSTTRLRSALTALSFETTLTRQSVTMPSTSTAVMCWRKQYGASCVVQLHM